MEAEIGVKERLKTFLKAKNSTPSSLSRQIGVSGAFVNNIVKTIGADKLAAIQALYPDLNRDWLLYGDGEMIMPSNTSSTLHLGHSIRYWTDVDATAGGVQLFDDALTNCYTDMFIPEFTDCTDAVNLYGDSMSPLYKNGQIIILKQWKESFIDFGNVYLVVTRSGNRMVKYLRRGSDCNTVLCVSENKDFDSFELSVSEILTLYLVKGSISKNTL